MGAHIMKIVYQQRRGSEKPHNLYDGDHEINDVCMPAIVPGRPRKKVDYGLLLALRIDENLGWSRVAMEYTRRTANGGITRKNHVMTKSNRQYNSKEILEKRVGHALRYLGDRTILNRNLLTRIAFIEKLAMETGE